MYRHLPISKEDVYRRAVRRQFIDVVTTCSGARKGRSITFRAFCDAFGVFRRGSRLRSGVNAKVTEGEIQRGMRRLCDASWR